MIAHAVLAVLSLPPHFRDVRDLLAERGIVVGHEAIRQWCTKFGQIYAAGLRRRRPRLGDKWHLDEVLLKTRGKRHWVPNLRALVVRPAVAAYVRAVE